MKKIRPSKSSLLLGPSNFFHWAPSRSASRLLSRANFAKLIYRRKSSLFWSDAKLFVPVLSSVLLAIFAEEGEHLTEMRSSSHSSGSTNPVGLLGIDFQDQPFRQAFARTMAHAVQGLPPTSSPVTFRENFIPGLALVLFGKPLEDGFWYHEIINRLFPRSPEHSQTKFDFPLADINYLDSADGTDGSEASASSGVVLAVANLIERFTERTHMKVILIETIDALFVFCPSQDLLSKLQQNYFDYSLESLE